MDIKVYCRYMVSLRCKGLVSIELAKLGVRNAKVTSGLVEFKEVLTPHQIIRLNTAMAKLGIELLDVKNSGLLERAAQLIHYLITEQTAIAPADYSNYLYKELNVGEAELMTLFAEVHGVDLPHFILVHRVERVKELVLYDTLSMSKIAQLLQFGNVAELVGSFKRVTGLSPAYYKSIRQKRTRIMQRKMDMKSMNKENNK